MPTKDLAYGSEHQGFTLRFIDAKGLEKEVVGDYEQVHQLPDGPTFLTTILGSRLPAAFVGKCKPHRACIRRRRGRFGGFRNVQKEKRDHG